MNLVFLGPPGSGKGTQAERLAEKQSLPHIAVGDLLREEVRKNSETGQRIKAVMEAGNLVPDEVTITLTCSRITQPDAQKGFILDGFPRNTVQAEALDKRLKEENKMLNRVVYFDISEEQIVNRLSGRRSCKKCGAVYHLQFNPPKNENVCDKCGGELYQRADDAENAIRTRFAVYRQQTQPLIDRYKREKILVNVEAGKDIKEVFAELLLAIQYGS
ncbi:MAG: adenylate kinase [Candidatus Margulisbacteria bacterium]|nr:adenylate kinase [Candidatus Margulisiibacteriota bacterium]